MSDKKEIANQIFGAFFGDDAKKEMKETVLRQQKATLALIIAYLQYSGIESKRVITIEMLDTILDEMGITDGVNKHIDEMDLLEGLFDD